MDDLFDEFGFLAWYFTFMDTDTLNCPYCGEEIEIDGFENSPNDKGAYIICPHCESNISKEDFTDHG